jgi:hypothetical protein
VVPLLLLELLEAGGGAGGGVCGCGTTLGGTVIADRMLKTF